MATTLTRLSQSGSEAMWCHGVNGSPRPLAREEPRPHGGDDGGDHDYVLELIHGFLKTQVLHTGVSCGVFEALEENGRGGRIPLVSLAQKLQLPPENAEKLLNALAALELVVRESTSSGIYYRGTARSSRYLTRGSPVSLIPLLDMAMPMMQHMTNLGDSLKTAGWFKEMELSKDAPEESPGQGDTCNKRNYATNNLIDPTQHKEAQNGRVPFNGLTAARSAEDKTLGEQKAPPNELTVASSTKDKTSNGPKVPSNGLTAARNADDVTSNGPKAPPNGTTAAPSTDDKTVNGPKAPSNGIQTPPVNCFEAMAGKMQILDQFQRAMNSYAVNACHLLDDWKLEKCTSAVDLGGGLGAFGRYLAAEHAHIHTTVYDIPPVVELGKSHMTEKERSRQNLNFQAGDFFGEDLPEADIYILGHILHDWREDECRIILKKVHKALKPGGVLFILEKLVDSSRDGPLSALLLNLLLMMSTPGEERTLEQYSAQLEDTGFRLVTHRLDSAYNWYDVILAKKA